MALICGVTEAMEGNLFSWWLWGSQSPVVPCPWAVQCSVAAVACQVTVGVCWCLGTRQVFDAPGADVGPGRGFGVRVVVTCCPLSPLAQRAIRVRSHSMETMVGSQKKHHGSGIPGSLSGGIAHNSGEVTKTTFSVSAAAVPLSRCPSVRPSWPGGALHVLTGSGCPCMGSECEGEEVTDHSVILSVLWSSWACFVGELKRSFLGLSAQHTEVLVLHVSR